MSFVRNYDSFVIKMTLIWMELRISIYVYMHTHVDMSKGWTNPQQGSGHFFHKVNWGVAHKIVDHAKLVN